eukprot:8455402-Alexandrium_andersonii.AAC.1
MAATFALPQPAAVDPWAGYTPPSPGFLAPPPGAAGGAGGSYGTTGWPGAPPSSAEVEAALPAGAPAP